MSEERLRRALQDVREADGVARQLRARARDELRAAVWDLVERDWAQVEVARFMTEATGEEWSRQRLWALMHERDDEYEEVGR